MIEKEFKELYNSISIERNDKNINSVYSVISNCINETRNFKIIDMTLEKTNNSKVFNVIICLSPKNKTLPFDFLKTVCLNEIENNIVLNIKNNYVLKSIDRINNNTLKIKVNEFDITFNIKYKKDTLSKLEEGIEYYEDYLINKAFIQKMDKQYSRFNQTLVLVEYFCSEMKLEFDYLMSAIILSYALKNYETENSNIGYLKTFVFGLSDLIEEKTIILDQEIYSDFKILGTIVNELDKHKVIALTNKQLNLFSNKKIKDYKELKSLITSKFPRVGNFITIECYPNFVVIDKTIEWSFKIIDTDIENSGGEYEYNPDNYYMCTYKGLLKGLQYIVKNKLGNNVVVNTNNLSLFPYKDNISELSYENQSRYANVLTYIKDNDLGIDFKLVK